MVVDSPILFYVTRGPENKTALFAHALARGDSQGLMTLCPDNQPPTDGIYICIIAVLDYWRMNSQTARQRAAWHYSTGIEAPILVDVRARRCALVFDLCNEGMPYEASIFDELFHWIADNRLPAQQVIWLDQNRNMEASCRSKNGSEPSKIRFENYDFFVKQIAYLFSRPTAREIVGPDIESFIETMYDAPRKEKVLLCLNATPKLWRVVTLGALIQHDLFQRSLISFPGMIGAKGVESPDRVRRLIDSHDSLTYLRPGVEAAMQLTQLKVDDFTDTGNALYERIDSQPYQRTFFSIVTETDFSDGSIARITEKLVKPFCLGHPSIVVGNPHSVRFMTELGFQSWTAVIDYTYDTESDPIVRFGLLLKETLRQSDEIKRDPNAWIASVRETGTANIRHSLSGQFLGRYRQHYDFPLLTRLRSLLSGSRAE